MLGNMDNGNAKYTLFACDSPLLRESLFASASSFKSDLVGDVGIVCPSLNKLL